MTPNYSAPVRPAPVALNMPDLPGAEEAPHGLVEEVSVPFDLGKLPPEQFEELVRRVEAHPDVDFVVHAQAMGLVN